MSDSSSDDTDADDEEEFKQNQKRASEWLTEEEDSVPTGPPRTKNEIAFDNSHIYDPDAMETGCFNNDCDGTSAPLDFDREKVNISIVSDELNEIGTIMCRMDEERTLVVQASYTESPLNEGSLLFFKEKVVIGKVCEIFGPITTPFYVVRWAASSAAIISGNKVTCNKDGNKKLKKKKKNRKQCEKILEEKNIAEEEVESGFAAIVEDAGAESIVDEGATIELSEERGSDEVTKGDKINVGDCTTKVLIEEVTNVADAAIVDMSLGDTLTADPLISTVETNISHIDFDADDIGDKNRSQILSAPCVNPVVASTAQLEHFISLMSRALPGTSVYSASKHTVVITASSLSAIRNQGRGTDASNLYDEEIADDEQEYSDDEAELLAKQERNRSKRGLGSSGEKDIKSVYTGGNRATDFPSSGRSIRDEDKMGVTDNQKSVFGLRHHNQATSQHRQDLQIFNHTRGPIPVSFRGIPQQVQEHRMDYHPQQYGHQLHMPNSNPNMSQAGTFPGRFEGNVGYQYTDPGHHEPYNNRAGPNPQQQPFTGYPAQTMGYPILNQHPTHLPNQNQSHHHQSREAWQNGGNPRHSEPGWIMNNREEHYQGPQQQFYDTHQQQHQQQQQQQLPPFHFPTHIQQPRQHAATDDTSPPMPWAGFAAPNVAGTEVGGTAVQRPPTYTYQPIQYDHQTSNNTRHTQNPSNR